MTEKYFLLGGDVSRSLSPAMMNAAFKSTGVQGSYEAVSVSREEFREKFLSMRAHARGFNLTIPFKSDVLPLLDGVDEIASRIGAANVVKRSDSTYIGYNTDVNGITAPLREHGKSSVAHALVIGAGGAARAFCEAMNQVGCTRVTVAARDEPKGKRFASEMSSTFPAMNFRAVSIDGLGDEQADLIFNASPLGSPGVPVPDALKRVIYGHATVFDAVYRPMKTELLRTAEEKGSQVIFGYEMLLNQGTMAFEIWTGKRAPKEVMGAALRDSLGAGS